MITVKVSSNFPHWPLARQTVGGSGVWGECRFLVNQDVATCDYWVVMDGLSAAETTRCARENTLLVTCEPPDVKTYAPDYSGQFGAVLTSHRRLAHPRVYFRQQGLPWMIGARLEPQSLTWTDFLSFEQLEAHAMAKTKLLSIVASKDGATPGHFSRNRFIAALQREFGDQIDVFGLGFLPIADKVDAIAPYRFHIAVENSCVPDYWTEKLADAYLGRAYPIYCGCPNITDYFPADSLTCLDISDADAAVARVRELVATDIDRQREAQVAAARQRLLYEHNVFAMLDRMIADIRKPPESAAAPLTLYPEAPAAAAPAGRNRLKTLLARYLPRRKA